MRKACAINVLFTTPLLIRASSLISILRRTQQADIVLAGGLMWCINEKNFFTMGEYSLQKTTLTGVISQAWSIKACNMTSSHRINIRKW